MSVLAVTRKPLPPPVLTHIPGGNTEETESNKGLRWGLNQEIETRGEEKGRLEDDFLLQ